MPEERRQVTLSKAHRATPVGRQLIDLLAELSSDGNVSRDEMTRLRAWLEIDHGVDFPALPFLYETIEQISSDGEVTEDELDLLALAIERVLPKDIRLAAIAIRKQAHEARRAALRETRRESMIGARSTERTARDAERAREGVLFKAANFPVAGAFRSEERREACERLLEGDIVTLEREPSNAYDPNAILVFGQDNCELGYVRREVASAIAPLLDADAEADARVHRLWTTPEGQIVPFLTVTIRRGDADPSIAVEPVTRRSPSDKGGRVWMDMSLLGNPAHTTRPLKVDHMAPMTRRRPSDTTPETSPAQPPAVPGQAAPMIPRRPSDTTPETSPAQPPAVPGQAAPMIPRRPSDTTPETSPAQPPAVPGQAAPMIPRRPSDTTPETSPAQPPAVPGQAAPMIPRRPIHKAPGASQATQPGQGCLVVVCAALLALVALILAAR